MDQADIDKLLKRRLFLQRYVTQIVNELRKAGQEYDDQIIDLLNDFVNDADEKSLHALARRRTSNPAVRVLLGSMREIIRDQRVSAIGLMRDDLERLIEQEIAYTAAVNQSSTVSSRGVLTLPVNGKPYTEIIAGVFVLYATRLTAELSQRANDPTSIVRMVKGSRPQRYRDGLYYWRDSRLMRPNIDVIVNGTAQNAANEVYAAAGVEMMDHLATLDFRTCPSCYTAEANSPYERGTEPSIPIHPNCRCISISAGIKNRVSRPYVQDDRPVRKTPKSERRVGETRDTIKQFFDRMTQAERVAYMGRTRAELWAQGKITDIRQLVNDRTLEPLTLDELPTP